MFMNSCANKPLYQGEMEKVSPYMLNTYDSAPTSRPMPQSVPFPRMGYDLDERVPIPPEGLMNNNLRMGEQSQNMMFGSNNMNGMMEPQGEARLQAKRNTNTNGMPMGMRLPMMSTKGKMGVNPSQLFDSDNDSVYDSDGEYGSV